MMIKLTCSPIHRMLAVSGLSRLRLITLDRNACISATFCCISFLSHASAFGAITWRDCRQGQAECLPPANRAAGVHLYGEANCNLKLPDVI